ncbi:hypothetical protein [Helicobacter labetoulli]|uniref:hypothetical protein n=1 Tax=Helicobacter labetoulli TaxID=2315333 RepID=UPI0031345C41
MDKKNIQQEIILRTLAQKDLYSFLKLKWERYNNAPFMEGWHIQYLCKILESTLPNDCPKLNHSENPHPTPPQDFVIFASVGEILADCTSGKQKSGRDKKADTSRQETHEGEVFASDFNGCEALSAETSHKGCRTHEKQISLKSTAKTSQTELITRLMINMPPSYGKTEIIARSFIAWALGKDRKRKFFYISYSDELCRKIANQVRDLLKSKLWSDVFLSPPQFLQDNAQEFVLREGGGLFVTTLKSALTGFHAHQILIDDPIKVSEMSSRAARNLVNQNFKESVLSRLQDNKSNITILMQRLGVDDLCGFLLNEREFDKDVINQWKQISLKAIEKKDTTYTQGDFSYFRKKGESLFRARHTEAQLEHLRLQMGNDEFSSQYLQEPLITSGGYFDEQYFSYIWGYEIGKVNT